VVGLVSSAAEAIAVPEVSDWISFTALLLSIITVLWTWRIRVSAQKVADVSAYFHRLGTPATVQLGGGESVAARYHLVLYNRGPASARLVILEPFGVTPEGDLQQVTLIDVGAGEFPIAQLDRDVRYPIPWVLGKGDRPFFEQRRFVVKLSWSDGSGDHHRDVILRRGNVRD
jgi:hypothetical protein